MPVLERAPDAGVTPNPAARRALAEVAIVRSVKGVHAPLRNRGGGEAHRVPRRHTRLSGGMQTFVSMPTEPDAVDTIKSLYLGFRIAASNQPQFTANLNLNGTVTYPTAARWIEVQFSSNDLQQLGFFTG
jgi:hypothetical protein